MPGLDLNFIPTEYMKITIEVSTHNQKYIGAIMKHCLFNEIERVATGGMHSNPFLLITYEGKTENLDKELYIRTFVNGIDSRQYYIFYSIDFPDGFHATSVEQFEERINEKNTYFEIEKLK